MPRVHAQDVKAIHVDLTHAEDLSTLKLFYSHPACSAQPMSQLARLSLPDPRTAGADAVLPPVTMLDTWGYSVEPVLACLLACLHSEINKRRGRKTPERERRAK